jgi:hypothetical protein
MRSPAAIVELLDLVEGSGLKFQGWLDSAPYNIGFPDRALESLCKELPDRDGWSIVEDLTIMRLTLIMSSPAGRSATRTARSTSAETNGYRTFPLTPFREFCSRVQENSRAEVTSSNCQRRAYRTALVMVRIAGGAVGVGELRWK